MRGLYVAGWGSGAGKSTTCMCLLKELLDRHPAKDLAYIKPVTQCESETEVSRFCKEHNVSQVGVGPVVFVPGFTTSVIADPEPAKKKAELLTSVKNGVQQLSVEKQFVIVDGVGYPGVGSCCGVSNADVASILGFPVVLVAPPGLGDALDTVDMMRVYFEAKGCVIAGVIFNKLEDSPRHTVDSSTRTIREFFRVSSLFPVLAFVKKQAGDREQLFNNFRAQMEPALVALLDATVVDDRE